MVFFIFMPSLWLNYGQKTPLPTGKETAFWTLEGENKGDHLGIT
jgi:hypothetical protein